ncbi:MAG TPA: right-handed parallel beta-helix repeat-containing protein [Polyangia bacterium]|jgi:hypothetical protein
MTARRRVHGARGPRGSAWALTLAVLLVGAPGVAPARQLTQDATWERAVVVEEDVLVPAGVTLRIRAGTVVTVRPSASTRTEPEYVSALTEITVRGTLLVEGTAAAPVVFAADPGTGTVTEWAGIVVDGGTARLRSCRVSDAETGVAALGGAVVMRDCDLARNRYGLVVSAGAAVRVDGGAVRDNDYGVVLAAGARVLALATTVRGNRKKDTHRFALRPAVAPAEPPALPEPPVGRILGDSVLAGDTVWSGRVVVAGIVRVPEGSRLVILPGTVVEFRRRDGNGDGIGDNGLLLQGVLIAKGEKDRPIVFRSAEPQRRPGDWDSINIMGSDGAQSLVEYCVIEDAYRGLHFHFANVAVIGSWLRRNLRAMQFQESQVEIRRTTVTGNRTGIQGRDSKVVLEGSYLGGNLTGANFFRVDLLAEGNVLTAHGREAIRLREGAPVLTGNVVHGNRYGVLVSDAFRGELRGNVIDRNGELGLAARASDNLVIAENFIAENGLSGVSLRDTRARFEGNHVAHNGERGLDLVDFRGVVAGNGFVGNGRFAVELEGAGEVDAPDNYWGEGGPARVIREVAGAGGRGRVQARAPRASPPPFRWPLAEVLGEVVWDGRFVVARPVRVPPGAGLHLRPATVVAFAPRTGLTVQGRIEARGQPRRPVVFTAHGRGAPGAWDEILVERALGSVFHECVLEYATWALHVHFTDLVVTRSRFRHNLGGLRFRSGPVTISDSVFEQNGVGIRAYRGQARIAGNAITRNDVGLFVREQGGGLQLRGNDLHGNRRFAVRLGDFNSEDVDARGNFWGTADPGAVIHDARTEPGIGRVLHAPALAAPVRPERP